MVMHFFKRWERAIGISARGCSLLIFLVLLGSVILYMDVR